MKNSVVRDSTSLIVILDLSEFDDYSSRDPGTGGKISGPLSVGIFISFFVTVILVISLLAYYNYRRKKNLEKVSEKCQRNEREREKDRWKEVKEMNILHNVIFIFLYFT